MSNPYFDPTIQDQYYDTGSSLPKKPGPNVDWTGAATGIAGLGLNAYAMANQGRRLNQGIAPSQYDLNSAPSYTGGNAQYEASTAKSQGATGGEVLGGTSQGAAAGTAILPGIGTAVGAVVGAASSLIGGAARADRQRKEREAALRRVAGAQLQYNAQDVAFRNQQNQMQGYFRRVNPYNREYAVNQTRF